MPVRSAGAARALVVLASVAMVLAIVAGYARRAVVDSDQFSNRATVALGDPSVRTLIADKITDEVVLKNQSDLLAARPIIQSVASGVVGSSAFTSLFRSAVRDVHRALFDRDENTVTLTVADVGTVLAAALERLRPSLANQVEATGKVEIVKRDVGDLSSRLVNIADTVRVLALLLAAAALALAAGAQNRAAAGAVWDAFLGDLRTIAWIVAGSGAVVAAAAASLIRPVALGEPLRRAAAWVATEPRRPALRAVRGVALVAAGVVVLTEHEWVLQLAFSLLGAYLVYEGVSALLWLIYRPAEEERPRPRRHPLAWLMRRRGLVTAAIAAAVIVGAAAAFLGTGGTTTAAPPSGACDGHEGLCDRPLAQVALPATH